MKDIRALWLLCLALLVLVGCSNAQPAQVPTAQPAASSGNTDSAPQVISVPSPSSAQVGVVTGKVFRLPGQDNTSIEPLSRLHIYLAELIKTKEGMQLASLSKDTAPTATLDTQGTFAFADVPPGRYGLMLDTPQGVVLLNQPDSGTDLIVEVQGGKVTNLGDLKYKFNF